MPHHICDYKYATNILRTTKKRPSAIYYTIRKNIVTRSVIRVAKQAHTATLDRQRTERKYTKRNKNEMCCCCVRHSHSDLSHHFHCPFNANLLYMIFQPFSFRNGESSSPNTAVSTIALRVFVIISSDAISPISSCELWKQNVQKSFYVIQSCVANISVAAAGSGCCIFRSTMLWMDIELTV